MCSNFYKFMFKTIANYLSCCGGLELPLAGSCPATIGEMAGVLAGEPARTWVGELAGVLTGEPTEALAGELAGVPTGDPAKDVTGESPGVFIVGGLAWTLTGDPA
jgi:hypothetical protein